MRELGSRGEALAAQFLIGLGWRVLGQNIRRKLFEIDILALDGETIVVVEVKTRTSSNPLLGVDARKLRHLRRAMHVISATYPAYDVRLDIISVYWKPDSEPVITHYQQTI